MIPICLLTSLDYNRRLIHIYPNEYFEKLQMKEIQAQLQELGEAYTPEKATETLREKLKFLNRHAQPPHDPHFSHL